MPDEIQTTIRTAILPVVNCFSEKHVKRLAHGEDRLIQPRFDRSPETKPLDQDEQGERGNGGSGGGRGGGDGRQGASGAIGSFEQELLAKFPPFDPSWSEELKTQWFSGFQQFLAMAKGQPAKE